MALEQSHSEKSQSAQQNTATEKSDIAFLCIDPHFIDSVWDKCSHFVGSAFSEISPTYSLDDLKRNLKTGECQLWVAVGMGRIMAAAVTMLTVEPLAKTCAIMHVGGENVRLWINELDKEITKFAKDNGCQFIEAVTRRGFHRFLPSYQEDGVVYTKVLKDG